MRLGVRTLIRMHEVLVGAGQGTAFLTLSSSDFKIALSTQLVCAHISSNTFIWQANAGMSLTSPPPSAMSCHVATHQWRHLQTTKVTERVLSATNRLNRCM